jgi:hypothetical protein
MFLNNGIRINRIRFQQKQIQRKKLYLSLSDDTEITYGWNYEKKKIMKSNIINFLNFFLVYYLW